MPFGKAADTGKDPELSTDDLEEQLQAETQTEQVTTTDASTAPADPPVHLELQRDGTTAPKVEVTPVKVEPSAATYISSYPQLIAYAEVGQLQQNDRAGNSFTTMKTVPCPFMHGRFVTDDPDIIASLDKQVGIYFRRATEETANKMARLALQEITATSGTEKGTSGSTTSLEQSAQVRGMMATQSEQNSLFNQQEVIPPAVPIEGLPEGAAQVNNL